MGKQLKLSDLYGKLIEGKMTQDERMLLAKIIKDLAIYGDISNREYFNEAGCQLSIEMEPRDHF